MTDHRALVERLAEMLADAERKEQEHAAYGGHIYSSYCGRVAALKQALEAADALRASGGPTLTKEQFIHAANIAVEYGGEAGYRVALDYLKAGGPEPGRGAWQPHVSSLANEIATALNRHSAENESNTPDFILAKFLLGCLAAWDNGVRERERWHGRSPNDGPLPPPPADGGLSR